MEDSNPEEGDTQSDDAFLGGALQLLQPRKGYRAGIDAVLLAAGVPALDGETILDAGSGAGVAALCLAKRVEQARVIGIEIQEHMVQLATTNRDRNALTDRVSFILGDIMAPPMELLSEAFDHVMCNPPYYDRPGAFRPAPGAKGLSNMGSGAQLSDWLEFCMRRLKSGGRLTLIHRADRLDEIVGLLYGHLGGIRILPLWPRLGEPAKRVILSGVKGGRSPVTLLPGLVLHEEGRRYSRDAEAVLRDGAPLPL